MANEGQIYRDEKLKEAVLHTHIGTGLHKEAKKVVSLCAKVGDGYPLLQALRGLYGFGFFPTLVSPPSDFLHEEAQNFVFSSTPDEFE